MENVKMYLIFYALPFFLPLLPPFNKANAQTKNTFKKIDQLNRPAGSQDRNCQNCLKFSGSDILQPEQEQAILQQCAVDLCGPADENKSHTLINNNNFNNKDIDPEIEKKFNEKIRPVIESVFQTELNHKKNTLKSLQDKLQNPESNIESQEWDKLAETLYWAVKGELYIMDMSSTNSEHSLSKIKMKGYDSYEESKNKRQRPLIMDGMLTLPSFTEQKDFLETQYQDFLKIYEKNKTRFTEEEKREISQMGDELDNNLNIFSIAANLDDLMKKGKNIVFCIEKDCQRWVVSELTSLRQDLEENISSDNQNFTRQLNHCKSVYNANLQGIEHAKRYEQKIARYKERFLSKVFANYSDVSQQSYADYMNNITFHIPLIEQDVEKGFIDNIKEETLDNSSVSNNKLIDLIQNSDRLKPEYSICPSPMKEIDREDSFMEMENSVNISNFSCHFHGHGKQILAHELGHALSYWFSNTKHLDNKLSGPSKKSYNQYMSLRKCANERYNIDMGESHIFLSFDHENDNAKTEEDMADLIAYKVFQDEPTLLACSLFSVSEDSQYEKLTILGSDPGEIKTSHSMNLVRAIAEAIHKRQELSPNCQKIVDIYKDIIDFEPCF